MQSLVDRFRLQIACSCTTCKLTSGLSSICLMKLQVFGLILLLYVTNRKKKKLAVIHPKRKIRLVWPEWLLELSKQRKERERESRQIWQNLWQGKWLNQLMIDTCPIGIRFRRSSPYHFCSPTIGAFQSRHPIVPWGQKTAKEIAESQKN